MNSRTSELNPNKNLDTQDILYYNYYETPIYPYYSKTPNNGGYIKLPCAYNLKSPNISSSAIGSDYVCSAIYITKALHKIANTSFDGELVLEHTPITNAFKKVFVCIPLKTHVGHENSENPIDRIITLSEKKDDNKNSVEYFSLNKYLNTSERVILYDSPGYLWNQTVVLFSKPILVNSRFDDFISDPELFHSTTNTYTVLASQQITEMSPISLDEFEESVIEGYTGNTGNTGNTKTAYCQPIDVIDSSISASANLEIPLTGKYSPNDATNNMVRVILNFVAFFALLIATFFGIPYVYDIFIVQLILFNKTLLTGQDKLNRLRSVDIFVSVVLITFVFVLITSGVSTNNTPQVIIGFFFFIFIAVSIIRIQIIKNDPTEFLKQFGSNVYFSTIKDDVGNFLKDNFTYLLYTKTGDPPNYSFSFSSIIIVFGFFVALVFTAAMMKLVKMPSRNIKGLKNPKSNQSGASIYFYIAVFSIYLGILAKYWSEKGAGVIPALARGAVNYADDK